jgi:hypothetical protein
MNAQGPLAPEEPKRSVSVINRMRLNALLLLPILLIFTACTRAQPRDLEPLQAPSRTSQPVGSPLPGTPQASGPTQTPAATPVTVIAETSLQPSGPGGKQYTVPAASGQRMTIDVTSDGVPLSLTITNPSGKLRFPETSQVDGVYQIHQEFIISETGDYRLTLTKPDHTPSTNYTVTVTLR